MLEQQANLSLQLRHSSKFYWTEVKDDDRVLWESPRYTSPLPAREHGEQWIDFELKRRQPTNQRSKL